VNLLVSTFPNEIANLRGLKLNILGFIHSEKIALQPKFLVLALEYLAELDYIWLCKSLASASLELCPNGLAESVKDPMAKLLRSRIPEFVELIGLNKIVHELPSHIDANEAFCQNVQFTSRHVQFTPPFKYVVMVKHIDGKIVEYKRAEFRGIWCVRLNGKEEYGNEKFKQFINEHYAKGFEALKLASYEAYDYFRDVISQNLLCVLKPL